MASSRAVLVEDARQGTAEASVTFPTVKLGEGWDEPPGGDPSQAAR